MFSPSNPPFPSTAQVQTLDKLGRSVGCGEREVVNECLEKGPAGQSVREREGGEESRE